MKLAIKKQAPQQLELPDQLDGMNLAELAQPAIQNFESWDHQRLMFNFLQSRGSGLLWAAMGTGKTKVVIDCVQNSAAQRVLILSPKAVLPVWRREIARHCVTPHDVRILDQAGTAAKSRELEKLCSSGTYLGFTAVNYESAWRDPLADRLHEIARDFVICDESQKIKSNRSRASQFARSLDGDRRIAMSGTPLPAGAEDIYAQMDFLERDVLGEWWEFADDYLTFRPQSMQVVGYQNLDHLASHIAPHVLQVPASVLDLPEISHQTIPVKLQASTRRQ